MITTESIRGRITLGITHVAGMIDLVALPLWIGALVGSYKFGLAQAGGLVTLFLVGAVLSSLFFAPRFNKIASRVATTTGFAIAVLAFLGLVGLRDFTAMAPLHFVAGVAVGCGLSFTHGTIGRSANPHRLWAFVNIGVGVFAIVFMGGAGSAINTYGGTALFLIFALIMAIAALAAALFFPVVTKGANAQADAVGWKGISAAAWFAIAGVTFLGVNQAMMFAFVERIGVDRGVKAETIVVLLIGTGIVNLFPPLFAALLEKRLPAIGVALAGPVAQAIVANVLSNSAGFLAYAVPLLIYPAIIIFTHAFVFGLIARLDPSGRGTALTPAALLSGAAVGPVLGGSLVDLSGTYASLGIAATIIALIAVGCFVSARRRMNAKPAFVAA